MKTFFSKLWWLFKPLNIWNVAVYLLFTYYVYHIQVTMPPSKVITDYKQTEGVLTRVSYTGKQNQIPVIKIAPKGSSELLYFTGHHVSVEETEKLLNQPVVVYSLPAHGLELKRSDHFVFMAPLAKKQDYLDAFYRHESRFGHFGFDKPYLYVGNTIWTCLIYLFLWLWNFGHRVKQEEKKKIN